MSQYSGYGNITGTPLHLTDQCLAKQLMCDNGNEDDLKVGIDFAASALDIIGAIKPFNDDTEMFLKKMEEESSSTDLFCSSQHSRLSKDSTVVPVVGSVTDYNNINHPYFENLYVFNCCKSTALPLSSNSVSELEPPNLPLKSALDPNHNFSVQYHSRYLSEHLCHQSKGLPKSVGPLQQQIRSPPSDIYILPSGLQEICQAHYSASQSCSPAYTCPCSSQEDFHSIPGKYFLHDNVEG